MLDRYLAFFSRRLVASRFFLVSAGTNNKYIDIFFFGEHILYSSS